MIHIGKIKLNYQKLLIIIKKSIKFIVDDINYVQVLL